MQWSTYILQCSDGSFYVGHTKDVQQRLAAHNTGQGADYTKTRRPAVLVYSEPHPSQAEAMAREKQLKKWSKAKKLTLIASDAEKLHTLAKRH